MWKATDAYKLFLSTLKSKGKAATEGRAKVDKRGDHDRGTKWSRSLDLQTHSNDAYKLFVYFKIKKVEELMG